MFNPSFIMSITMTASVFFAMINVERWDLHVESKTCFAIISGIIAFAIGGVWCSYRLNSIRARIEFNSVKHYFPYQINGYILFILSSIMLVLCYFSLNELYELSVLLGNDAGYAHMISVVRPAIEEHKIVLSRWMNYRHLLAQSITYFYLYIIIYNAIFTGFKRNQLLMLIPVCFYIPFIILTTGRMALMIMIIYCVVTIGVLYPKKYGQSIKVRLKLLGILSMAGLFFTIVFLLLGFFTGKVIGENRTPFIIFSHYAGLSIPALDALLNKSIIVSNYIGSNTMLGIYRIANGLGMHLPEVQIFLPFTQFNHIDTNVYTAMGRYICDFGYIGMMMVMWILGVLYTSLYTLVMSNKVRPFLIILYATYSFPLFLSSIDERFFLDILGTSLIYTIIISLILYQLLLSENTFNLYKGVCKASGNKNKTP
ncbi:O-antigen polymerase [Megasphaera sueciensis]|uniref:O-antigen polymerase n=1 Tax=Megasphaera sueciensis TaxID=349094 RepID=UPI003D0216FC